MDYLFSVAQSGVIFGEVGNVAIVEDSLGVGRVQLLLEPLALVQGSPMWGWGPQLWVRKTLKGFRPLNFLNRTFFINQNFYDPKIFKAVLGLSKFSDDPALVEEEAVVVRACISVRQLGDFE